jgi:hypothetical protein
MCSWVQRGLPRKKVSVGISTVDDLYETMPQIHRGGSHTFHIAKQTALADAHKVDRSGLTFVVGRSQEVLPTLRIEPVDLVLIDGQHAFPIPFLDWYYCNQPLRISGNLIVDDTQIWTGWVLSKFLSTEPEWRRLNDFFGRSASFEKLGHVEAEGWGRQPLVVRRSRAPKLAERARRRLAVATGRIPNEHNAKATMNPAARRIADGTP